MTKNKYYNVLLIIFILLPFFFPVGLKSMIPVTSKIIPIWQLISFASVIFVYFRYKKISLNIVLISIFCLGLLISTLLSNYNDISSCCSTILSIIVPCMLIDCIIKKNKLLMLRSLNFLFEIFVYINLITIIIYPGGMYVSSLTGYYENWLLGYDNLHIFTILLAITFSILYSYTKHSKISIRSILCIIVCILSVLLRWSGTAVMSIIFVLIYLLFGKYIRKIRIFNIKTYSLVSIASFVGIVICNVQNLFISFITNFLKKDITFTGRTYIWNYIMKYIEKKPLLGYGIEQTNYRYNKSVLWRSYHAHNEFLEISYLGGFFLLLIFLIILWIIVKNLFSCRKTKESSFISWMFLILMIVMLTEVYTISLLFLFIIIAMNIKFIVEEGR